MARDLTLTSTEVAQIASVNPSTIKRWADSGLLPYTRTAGGHRRFAQADVERFLRRQGQHSSDNEALAQSLECLIRGDRFEIDSMLLAARSRLGTWHSVADELSAVLTLLGQKWADGHLTIEDEHVASEALHRSIARICDVLPHGIAAKRCLLACVPKDDHVLGLCLAELCLREHGWNAHWLGRNTPREEIERAVRSGRVQAVGVSASAFIQSKKILADFAQRLGKTCHAHQVPLALGGSGSWPSDLNFAYRITTFTDFSRWIAERDVL